MLYIAVPEHSISPIAATSTGHKL